MTGDDAKAYITIIAIGAIGIYQAIKRHRQARKIQDTPTSKSFSAPQGLVELEGFAWPSGGKHKTANGIDAVYYSFRLEKKVTEGSGKNKRTKWVSVFTSVKGEAFYLADPTGLALIDVHDAELNLESARIRRWRSLDKEEQKRICQEIVTTQVSHFPPSDVFFGLFGQSFRVVEHEIYVGAPVYALGHFSSLNGSPNKVEAAGLTQFSERVFDRTKRSIKNLGKLLDKNNDGSAGFNEKKLGYAMIARVAQNKALQEKQKESLFDLHGSVGSSETNKMILGDAHQVEIVTRLTRFLWIKFYGSAGLIAVGIAGFMGVSPGSYFKRGPKPEVRIPAAEKSVATNAPAFSDAPLLHQQCVAGKIQACAILVQNSTNYQLNEQNLKYYRHQSCILGKMYCEK